MDQADSVRGSYRSPTRPRAQLSLLGGAAPASTARRFTRLALRNWGLEACASPRLDDVVLVASELVTNAVRHGGGAAWIAVDWSRRSLRLEVGDLNHRMPQPREQDSVVRPHGHGMRLVLHAADRLGVELTDEAPGKCVWADFHLAGEGARADVRH